MNKSEYFARKLFFLACLSGAVWRIAICLDNFIKDKSISNVEYRGFLGATEDIYPAISICFDKPFHEDKLSRHNVSVREYMNMLVGNYKNDEMEQGEGIEEKLYSIPYEDVSYSLEENSFSITSSFRNTADSPRYVKVENTFNANPFLRSSQIKCFTGQIQSKKPITDWKIFIKLTGMKKSAIQTTFFMHFPGNKVRLLGSKVRLVIPSDSYSFH